MDESGPARQSLGDISDDHASVAPHVELGPLAALSSGDRCACWRYRQAKRASSSLRDAVQAKAQPSSVTGNPIGGSADWNYYNGERTQYYPQFYEPYAHYPAPILAIGGNHDGDPLPGGEPSLAAFMDNFCAPTAHLTPEAQDVPREAMTQPNVYWTLEAPFLWIIGVYSNVPEGGQLDDTQIAWLHAELASVPAEVALVVTMHHPIYSMDQFHGGSAYMGGLLDAAVSASGRTPDAVLTGHVHNYQRFTRAMEGRELPYIVSGAGGYWHLHYMAKDDQGLPLPQGSPWAVPGTDVREAVMVRVLIVKPPHERLLADRVHALDDLVMQLEEAGYGVTKDYQEQPEGARGVIWLEDVLIYLGMKTLDLATEGSINAAAKKLANVAKRWAHERFQKKAPNQRPEYFAILDEDGDVLESWSIDGTGEHERTEDDRKRPYKQPPREVD